VNIPSETWLYAGGIFNLGFVIFHLMFWRLFRWKQDLALLTVINRAVMQILNLCLMFMFLVMAYVSLFHAPELLSTNLGRTLLVAFSTFWNDRANHLFWRQAWRVACAHRDFSFGERDFSCARLCALKGETE